MTKKIGLFLIAFLIFATGYLVGNGIPVVHAQSKNVAIPRAWGTCKGASSGGMTYALVFEASDGTVRVFYPNDNVEDTFSRK